MKLLITGAAGFMGSHFARFILKTYPNYSVINFDKLTYAGNPANVADLIRDYGDRYSFVQGDITDEAALEKVGSGGIDGIVNFAAETHVDRSIMDPSAFLMTDVIGTYRLLEYAKKYSVKTYIQISTDEVFGSVADGAFTETSPFEPNSPYAASKAAGDLLCRAYYRTYGVPVIVVHSCNFYGSHQYPEKLIPLFITNILEKKKVPVYGSGEQVREWIYTDDVCNAVDRIMRSGAAGEVYNIGTGHSEKNIDITRKLLKLMGADDGSIHYVADRPGHDARYAVDASKLRSLGWKPQISFDEGLARTVSWYRDHEEWWRPIKSGAFKEYYLKQYGNRL